MDTDVKLFFANIMAENCSNGISVSEVLSSMAEDNRNFFIGLITDKYFSEYSCNCSEQCNNTQSKKQTELLRDGTKFVSKSGMGKKEMQMSVAAYLENHYSMEEIAEMLQISVASVRTYASVIRKHYKIDKVDNERMIIFDRDYNFEELRLKDFVVPELKLA